MGINLNPKQSSDEDEWTIIRRFNDIICGMLIALSPIIIIQGSLDFLVAIILVFLNNAIIFDDWWLTSKVIINYKLKPGLLVLITVFYYNALIFLTIWLLAVGSRNVPLSGYLIILTAICIIDLFWCYSIHKYSMQKSCDNIEYETENRIQIKSWLFVDIVGVILYVMGYLLVSLNNYSLLFTAILICILYFIRRCLDEIAPRLIK